MGITLTEILDQYSALKKTLTLFEGKKESIERFFTGFVPKTIVFTGCGSSYMLCCSMRSIASVRIDTPVYALASGDLWLNAARYRRMLDGALVVSLSRSGRTSEVLRAYEAVRALGVSARFLSILCAEDTPLEAASDMTLCMPWAFDHSVCQTRCVSNLYAAGALLISILSHDPEMAPAFARMAALGDAYAAAAIPRLKAVAAKDWTHVVVLADGEIDGLAEEGALAFKEISQLPSNFYHILDVRHGPMVLIGQNTLVLAAVQSPACTYEQSLLNDIKKKGATLVCYSNLPIHVEGAECFSLGEDVGMAAGGLGLALLCQLTSYFKSFHMGCDPDKPDGLDPWINIQ